MNYKISFQERAAQAMMHLSKQSQVTLEVAREQAQWLHQNTKTKQKKEARCLCRRTSALRK